MALDQSNALKRAEEALASSNAGRAALEAYEGLCLCYTYGDQWARSGPTKRGSNLNRMPLVVDPTRSDLRMSLPMIGARVSKVQSRLAPKEIKTNAVPASACENDIVAAMVATPLLAAHLKSIDALDILRRASLWRVVIGSCMIARSIAPGPKIALRDAMGEPMMDEAGGPTMLPTFRHEWSVAPPHEFVRDAAAHCVDFSGEDVIGRERPVSVSWIKRNYGAMLPKDFESKTTMGELLDFQKFLYQSTGSCVDNHWSESKTPAVMVSEWQFRDDEGDAQQRWPWILIAFRDTRADGAENRALKPLFFGPNPFHQLSYHHFWYEEELGKPWARGVPSRIIHTQDMVNISYTTLLRQLVTHSGNKYLVEAGSLQDTKEEALTNVSSKPIYYRKGASKPERLAPGQVDPASALILQQTPQWMDWMLNMAPVQAGQAVARGEAAKAYQTRIDQADTVLNSINDQDEIQLNPLLTGTLFDIVKANDIESLRMMVSGEFTAQQIATLKQQDVSMSILGVEIVPDSLRPRTPDEQRSDSAMAIQTKMVTPETARRTLLVNGVKLDEKEYRAYRLQQLENQLILRGQIVDVGLYQDHDTHIWVIGLEAESTRWNSGYTDAQREALMEHGRLHSEAKVLRVIMEQQAQQSAMAQMGAQPQQSQQQPPAESQGSVPSESGGENVPAGMEPVYA